MKDKIIHIVVPSNPIKCNGTKALFPAYDEPFDPRFLSAANKKILLELWKQARPI